ncbi:MAG: hypothetical protein ACKVRP_02905 [Bacteroidota bacterium]
MLFSFLFIFQLLAHPLQGPGTLNGRLLPPWSTKQVIDFHLSIKESVMVQDVYKLLYQANFGVEHLLTDTAGVRSYLLNELESMDTINRKEELVERISIRNDIVRINLRSFKALNLDPEMLVQAMFLSAAETKPDTAMFYRQWNEFHDLARYGFLRFPLDEVETWHKRVEAGDLRAVHHSESYERTNAPAYRVVHRRVWREFMNMKDR